MPCRRRRLRQQRFSRQATDGEPDRVKAGSKAGVNRSIDAVPLYGDGKGSNARDSIDLVVVVSKSKAKGASDPLSAIFGVIHGVRRASTAWTREPSPSTRGRTNSHVYTLTNHPTRADTSPAIKMARLTIFVLLLALASVAAFVPPTPSTMGTWQRKTSKRAMPTSAARRRRGGGRDSAIHSIGWPINQSESVIHRIQAR